MATIECKSCGANVEITGGSVSGTCPYCGSLATLPQAAFDDRALVPMLVWGDDDEKFLATDGNIMMLLDKMAAGETAFVLLSEENDYGAFIQSTGDEDSGYELEYHSREDCIGRLHETECASIDELKDAFRKFRRFDFSFVEGHTWEVIDSDE